jgi:hypothetical protein
MISMDFKVFFELLVPRSIGLKSILYGEQIECNKNINE